MEPIKPRITAHAWRRMAQRNLTLSDVLFALKFGRRVHRAHAAFFFVGRSCLPAGEEKGWGRLVGTTVVVEDGLVVTAYRNRRALSKIRRKPKRPYYHGHRSRIGSEGHDL
jgi:hypothetical protein